MSRLADTENFLKMMVTNPNGLELAAKAFENSAPDLITHWRSLPKPRQEVYPKLIRKEFTNMICLAYPKFKKSLGEEAFKLLLDDFISSIKISSHYYRDIPMSFFASLKEIISKNSTLAAAFAAKPHLPELLDYEHSRYQLIFKKNPTEQALNENLSLDKATIVLNPNIHLKNYKHAVHEEPHTKRASTWLVVARHPDTHRVETTELNDVSYNFLLFAKSKACSITEIVSLVHNEYPELDFDNLQNDVLVLLAQLIRQRLVLTLK